MEKVQVTIIGAGIVGLALASEFTKHYSSVVVLEKEAGFGQGISSRNSEVIHSGIYYKTGSLKHTLCLEGNGLLYDYCVAHQIPHRRIGKLIVATDKKEITELEKLYVHAKQNEVKDIEWLQAQEIKKLEPGIRAKNALWSKNTGIIDTHSLMKSLAFTAESGGAVLSYHSELKHLSYLGNKYRLGLDDYKFESEIVINAAGLNCTAISSMLNINQYILYPCKGVYFRYHQKNHNICRLIYPVPDKHRVGLGIHATLDLAGGLRFGPDTQYVPGLNYEVELNKKQGFYDSIKKYYPAIKLEHLQPDFAGVRPKIQAPGQDEQDFIIKQETANGYPGFVNLIGIESPGLTSCLSLAKYVLELIK